MECPDVNVPIGEICKLEDEFKLEVQKLKEKLHPDMALEMDELYNKMVVKIRYTMYRIMLSFPNNSVVNGFINEVVKKLMIYTDPEENPRECNQVYVDGQGQSSTSVKKAKLEPTQTNIAQSVDQSRHRCMTEYCGLPFDNLDDLDQHTKLFHPQLNQLAMSAVENALTTIQSTGLIVSQQSSISTESTASIHLEVPVTSRLESSDNEECIDVGGQGQSSSSANNAKLDAAHSHHAQSQVTSQSGMTEEAKEEPQILNKEAMVCIGRKCFQLDCEQLFDTKEALNLHMWERHRIRAFPCLVKDCDKSFGHRRSRNNHIRNDHNDRSELHCPKCKVHPYKTVHGLSNHYTIHHSTQYQCSFGSCTFWSEDESLICNHYIREHMIACRQSACAKKFYAHAVQSQYQNILKHYHYKV